MHSNRLDYCPLAGEPCQSMCDVPCGQRRGISFVPNPVNYALVDGGYNRGEPPQKMRAAWLLMKSQHIQGSHIGNYTTLAVKVNGVWHEAVDWRLDSYTQPVQSQGDDIAGWLPYQYPAPFLKPI